ncbi:MAG: DUF5618 family protein [Bacteroidetes bacterium]|nr:DUF5618 family protein [Bacteroidota bacterium]
MVIREQNRIRTTYYNEAIRYMENARETLKKAGKEDRFYVDEKYVKTACGIAYNGVLKALDGYLLLKGIEKKKGRKDIEYYQDAIAIIDRKLLNYINSAYKVLHLNGYYDGIRDARVIAEGFNLAYSIIERIKPAA